MCWQIADTIYKTTETTSMTYSHHEFLIYTVPTLKSELCIYTGGLRQAYCPFYRRSYTIGWKFFTGSDFPRWK